MSYDKEIKRHIINLMSPGDHKHREMTEAAACKSCGHKFLKAQSEYNRLRHIYPEKFIRKEVDEGFSRETQNMSQMLDDRVASDKLYREHLRLLAFGTPEEKIRETRREQSGYYERHTGDSIRKIL